MKKQALVYFGSMMILALLAIALPTARSRAQGALSGWALKFDGGTTTS